jgi:hypothetical protein
VLFRWNLEKRARLRLPSHALTFLLTSAPSPHKLKLQRSVNTGLKAVPHIVLPLCDNEFHLQTSAALSIPCHTSCDSSTTIICHSNGPGNIKLTTSTKKESCYSIQRRWQSVVGRFNCRREGSQNDTADVQFWDDSTWRSSHSW